MQGVPSGPPPLPARGPFLLRPYDRVQSSKDTWQQQSLLRKDLHPVPAHREVKPRQEHIFKGITKQKRQSKKKAPKEPRLAEITASKSQGGAALWFSFLSVDLTSQIGVGGEPARGREGQSSWRTPGGGQTNTVHATATGREITANPGCDPTGATRVSASITRWWSLFILLLEEEALCCE